MSNSLAIAAVTATLRKLLFDGVNVTLAGTDVSARPPDRARTNGQGNQLNVFMYQTSLDPAWRNEPMPGTTKPGEDGRPPLPLSLYYLVTAYGEDDSDIASHRLLGRAMSILHDHPVLDPDEINQALADSGLDQQIERVRLTPQPMTLEEMSKLWTTFQTQYRISAAYQACVVLIESELPTRAPLPVLTRGEGDTGPVAQASTIPPFPTIQSVEPPKNQPSASLGDQIRLLGHHLDGTTSIRLVHPRLADPLSIAPDDAGAGEVKFTLPAAAGAPPAGLCLVRAVLSSPGKPDRFSNEVALAVAPKVSNLAAAPNAAGNVIVTLDVAPDVVEKQEVYLLLSEQQIPFGPVTAASGSLSFDAGKLPPATYLLRLRVDGVDSLLVDRSAPIPKFDPNQKVVVP